MGVTTMGFSFSTFFKRGIPKKPYLISEHFPENVLVFVESGATTVGKDSKPDDVEDYIEAYAAQYQEFIANNIDRITGFTELDSKIMGQTWVKQQRVFYEEDERCWPVFHAEHGLPALQELCTRYKNVAISSDAVEALTNLASITRSYQRLYGTTFHGLGIANPDNLRQIPFETASTLAWTSPMRRGETIVWDGVINRYPKKMKQQARLRYKSTVEHLGLDYGEFMADKGGVSTKVAIWSYLQLEKSMDKKPPNLHIIEGGKKDETPLLSDNIEIHFSDLDGIPEFASTNMGVEERKNLGTELVQRDPSEMKNLPVFDFTTKNISTMDDNGNIVYKDVSLVQSTGGSLRQCDNCFVAAKCPAFKEHNSCAFNFPVEVKTKEQLSAFLTAILEMQGTRVAFLRFAEETMGGGYPDPNLSQEIDRLFKLVANMQEMSTDKETLLIKAERSSAGGMISAIFGRGSSGGLNNLRQSLSEEDTTRIIASSIEE